jgi:D-alanine-D-alanine ligase-like ATP-grasp enzyme
MDHEPELSRKIELRIYTKIVHDLFDLNIQASHQSTLPNHQGLPLDQLSSQKIFPISSLLKQIAQENGWEIQTYSQGWFSKLSFGNIDRFVYGYMFPLNSSTSQKICSDKAATSTVLKEHKIPQIYHHSVALGENFSVWEKCVEVFEKYGKNVVCKPVDGSGGVNVEHVTSRLQLESVVTNLFKNYHEIAICGFEVIKREYRLIMLEGTAEIIFKKTPPYMVGDGVHSTQALVQQFLRAMEPKKRLNLIHNIDAKILLSHEVPNKGEKIFLHWKHNLGQGATCLIIGGQSFFEIGGKTESNKYESITKSMIELAKKTVSALNVRFASVDIVKVIESDGNKKLKIMEVNSGIMMDNLMEQYSSMGIILAKRVYSKALHISFNEADQKLA